MNRRTRETTRRLLPDGDRVIIYRQQYFGFFTLLEHTELTLSLEGKARRKAGLFRSRAAAPDTRSRCRSTFTAAEKTPQPSPGQG